MSIRSPNRATMPRQTTQHDTVTLTTDHLGTLNKEITMTMPHLDPVLETATPAIRPFRVNVSEEELVDLCRRVLATRWSDRETVSDQSQGVQLATLQELLRYWGTDYDWRTVEARLNALPQFITAIDGLDIHFLHVRSPQLS
jgi:Epoxide hydrolase N terminus